MAYGEWDDPYWDEEPTSKSPYEKAEEEGRLDEFTSFTDQLYAGTDANTDWSTYDPPGSIPPASEINLYDPNTWGSSSSSSPPPTTGGTTDASCGSGMHYDHGNKRCVPNSPTVTPTSNSGLGGGNRSFPSGQSGYSGNFPYGAQFGSMMQQLMGYVADREAREKDMFNRYKSYVDMRVPELRGEPFTETEEAGRRVKAFDSLNRERTRAKQRVIEQMGELGHGSQSGTITRALRKVDDAFDALQAAGENQLLLEGTRIREDRRRVADMLEQGLTGFGFTTSGLGSEILGGATGFSDTGLGLRGLDDNFLLQQMGLNRMSARDKWEEELARLQTAGMLSMFNSF